ncbi:hypothetical protein BST93_00055 [Nonlabens tegetincola]|nr:gliding motility-associated C-terminal domain-containing protein [Nonlabens tegetincola]PQJ21343.1 hypothetical protein BST93_00055 [Nonlabens tegetincola]
MDEGPNPDGDGNPNTGDTSDIDGDGIPDYLDSDPRRIRVWNAVTPNEDGRNDYFILEGIENFENTVHIYNRWVLRFIILRITIMKLVGLKVFQKDELPSSKVRNYRLVHTSM